MEKENGNKATIWPRPKAHFTLINGASSAPSGCALSILLVVVGFVATGLFLLLVAAWVRGLVT